MASRGRLSWLQTEFYRRLCGKQTPTPLLIVLNKHFPYEIMSSSSSFKSCLIQHEVHFKNYCMTDGHSTKLLVWSLLNPSTTASRGMYGCITLAALLPFRVLFWWLSDSLEERKSSVELRFLSDSKADGQKKQKKRSWKGKKENAGHLVIWLWRDRTDKNSQLSLTLSSFLLLCIHPFLSPQTLPPFFSLSYLSTSGQNFFHSVK